MTPERWQKAKNIFLHVRDADPGERPRLLNEACRDDRELLAEVQSLLRYGDEAGDFLEEPALRITLASEAGEGATSVVGRRIGAYAIIREIAGGGMGIVYEARQEHPERAVALKVMKAGLASAAARQRFEHESQVLARLSHPAIAHVYEAGTHVDGEVAVPFFAMEFVPDARTITDYVSSAQLSMRQRLTLFAEVCDAVHHGHQKGVIHRDLKPANILVSAAGQPKVIDFGVARMIAPGATMAQAQTVSGQLIGTLQYMSPEQFDDDPHELDIRSDVYGLGVVLFELLCGRLPYDVTKSGVYAVARVVKERQPDRPSTLNRALRGDLDTIVLKCLEKDRARRYQSAADLAGDIRRYLRCEPIDARRDSAFYVLRRNLYRHRWAAAVTVVSALGLLAFAVAATGLWRRSEAERQKASFERHKASVRLARIWTHEGKPADASAVLWREFLERDSQRTRFALWDFYLKYPRVYANAQFGRQVDVEYSPSGKWLAAVTADGRIIVYDALDPVVVPLIAELKVPAKVIKFAPQPPYVLYVGDSEGCVHARPFNDDTGRIGDPDPLLKLEGAPPSETRSGPATCLAVSTTGTSLAVGSAETPLPEPQVGFRDGRVRVWRLPNTTPMHDVAIPCRGVRSIAFSFDAALMAIGFQPIDDCPLGGGLEIWDAESREILRKTTVDAIPRRGVLFSTDGQHIFSGGDYLLDWQLSSPEGPAHEKSCESTHKWAIRSLVAGESVAAQYLAFGSGDGLIRFYDTDQGALLPIYGYHAHEPSDHIDVCFSPDGKFFASVGPDGLSVWQFHAADNPVATTREEPAQLLGMSDRATEFLVTHRVAPHPAVGPTGDKYQLEIWSDGTLVAGLTASADRMAASTRDGRRLAVWDMEDGAGGSIRVYAAPNWAEVVHRLELPEPVDPAQKTRVRVLYWLDEQGQILFVGHQGGTTAVWDVGSSSSDGGTSLHTFSLFDTECTRFCLDSRGEWLAACSEGGGADDRAGRVRVWRITGPVRVEDGALRGVEQKLEFAAHPYVWFISFVRDSKGRLLIATAGRPRSVYLWDAQTGALVGQLRGHGNSIRGCAAVGGNLLVTQSEDLTVRIWDIDEREELCVLYRGEPKLLSMAACGRSIAICDGARVTTLNLDDVDEAITRNRGYEAERIGRLHE